MLNFPLTDHLPGPPLLAAGGLVYSFFKSNIAGKVIVMVLLSISVFTWTLVLTRIRRLVTTQRQTRKFLRDYRADRTSLRQYRLRREYQGGTLYAVYLAGCRELFYHLPELMEDIEMLDPAYQPRRHLSGTQMRAVTSALERSVGEHAVKLEDRMTLLASAVSGAPFLGLLGTVWGVMDTFSQVAIAGRPDFAAMAPGVAGALLTTVVALLVAIPAMFGYNYLVGSIRALIVQMDNFAAEFAADLEHRFAAYPSRAPSEREES